MDKRLAVVFLLWLLPTTALIAQEKYRADSLLQILNDAQGSRRVEILKQLSRSYIGSDKEKALDYAKQTIAEAERLGNDSFIVISLNNIAAALQNFGDKRSSLPYLERAIAIAQKNGNQKQVMESLEFKATAYAAMKQMDKAVSFAQEALKYAEKLRDTVGILNGLEIVAAGYKDLKKNDESIKIYQQEMALLDHLPKRLFEKGRVCVNLGLVYFEEKRKQEAIALFEKGKMYFEKFQYPVGALVASINLADAYADAGQSPKAVRVYREILTLNESIHDPELAAISHTGLGAIEMENNQFDAALAHFKQAELSAKPAALFEPLQELYSFMTDLYSLQGDYNTAKIYKQLANDYTDSLLSVDVRDRVVDYQIQYETAEKEKEIAEQELKITAQESEIFRKNTLNYGLLASLLAFLVLAYLFYNRYRLRKKAELDAAIIREQQLGLNAVIEAQEAERKRIAKDLHDGIAQEMAAIRLGFSALQHKISTSAPAEAHQIGDLARQLDDSCTEVRSISHVMMPPVLEQQGLAPSLELLLRNTFQNSGMQYEFDSPRMPAQIDEKVKIGLYRIAQELLNNIVKHAKAGKVSVLLYEAGNQLILQVEDDGQGFDFEQARAKGTMGLLNILSRVSALNGVFQTAPAQPKGTLATVRIPVNV